MTDLPPALPEDWGVYQSTTRHEMKMLARRNWYVRMAEAHGLVPDPSQENGVAALMMALEPEVFPSEQAAYSWHRRRPLHVVEEHWGERIVPMRARIPDRREWLSLLVHATTEETAERHLQSVLPEGTQIRRMQ